MALKHRVSVVDQRFAVSSVGLGSTLDRSSKMRASNKWFRFLEKIVDGKPADKPTEAMPEIRFTLIGERSVALCMRCTNVGGHVCHTCQRPYCLIHWPVYTLRRDKKTDYERQICLFCIAEETMSGLFKS